MFQTTNQHQTWQAGKSRDLSCWFRKITKLNSVSSSKPCLITGGIWRVGPFPRFSAEPLSVFEHNMGLRKPFLACKHGQTTYIQLCPQSYLLVLSTFPSHEIPDCSICFPTVPRHPNSFLTIKNSRGRLFNHV